jgi:hypothetical protein
MQSDGVILTTTRPKDNSTTTNSTKKVILRLIFYRIARVDLKKEVQKQEKQNKIFS